MTGGMPPLLSRRTVSFKKTNLNQLILISKASDTIGGNVTGMGPKFSLYTLAVSKPPQNPDSQDTYRKPQKPY